MLPISCFPSSPQRRLRTQAPAVLPRPRVVSAGPKKDPKTSAQLLVVHPDQKSKTCLSAPLMSNSSRCVSAERCDQNCRFITKYSHICWSSEVCQSPLALLSPINCYHPPAGVCSTIATIYLSPCCQGWMLFRSHISMPTPTGLTFWRQVCLSETFLVVLVAAKFSPFRGWIMMYQPASLSRASKALCHHPETKGSSCHM